MSLLHISGVYGVCLFNSVAVHMIVVYKCFQTISFQLLAFIIYRNVYYLLVFT